LKYKGGICQTKIKQNDKEYKIKACENCNNGCTSTAIYCKEKIKNKNFWIYECSKCKNCNKKPLNDTNPFDCVECGSKKHTNAHSSKFTWPVVAMI
jgi:flavoprotein